ncbi:8813_t:CDS:2, partial [Funneliformis geosporum]
LYEIRWLAWYEAIKNICDSISALLKIFKESKKKNGKELYNQLTSWRTLAFLYYFNDILEHVTQLIQAFIDETNPFGNSVITYMDNELSFVEQDGDDFIMDIHDYATSVINELQQRFPNRSLFTSMKVLNPREWPKDSQELL